MTKTEFKPLIELIHLEVFFNPNTTSIDYNLRLPSNLTLEEIERKLTREICTRGDKARDLERQSKTLMDIRSMLKHD